MKYSFKTKLFYVSGLILYEIRRRFTGRKYHAVVDVTSECNLDCPHCYVRFGNLHNDKNKEIPLDVWREKFLEFRRKGIRSIALVGGEPTLRMDVVMLADEIFKLVFIISNGTKRIPEDFKHEIHISLDGDKETNDAIRGEGVFDTVIKNYRNDDRVVINMTLMENNYLQLEKLVKVVEENRFHGLVCNLYTPTVNENSEMHLSPAVRKKIIDEIKRVKKIYPDKFLISKSSIDWYADPDHRQRCLFREVSEHYDPDFNLRYCFANLDCSQCGCYGGAVMGSLTLKKILSNPLDILKKMLN